MGYFIHVCKCSILRNNGAILSLVENPIYKMMFAFPVHTSVCVIELKQNMDTARRGSD